MSDRITTEGIVGCTDGLGRCTVCGAQGVQIRHLRLYVIGSEGCDACDECAMALTEHARGMMRVASRCRMQGYKAALKVNEAKRPNAEVSDGGPLTHKSTEARPRRSH